MRILFAMVVGLGLAGCSNLQGVSPVTKAIVSKIGETVGIGEPEAPAAAPRRLTRAKIVDSGLAMVRAKVGEDTSQQTLTAVTDNGGFVTYASTLRQSMTMRGALVTATRGIETDLLSTKVFPGDPIAYQTPIADWPESVRRIYHLPGVNSPEGRVVDVICSFMFGETGELQIIEVVYPVIQVLESCQGEETGFENAHMADTRTGAIWRTRQWIGFQSAEAFIDVLEPYTE